jgi:MEMO1 family protein
MSVYPTTVRPKLRAIDMRPHSQNGQDYYVLRDPLELSDRQLLVPDVLAALLPFFDGSRSTQAIAQEFNAHYGVPIGAEMVVKLATALDEVHLLENERSTSAIQRIREEYRAAPHRPLLLADRGYPADPAALHTLLEGYRAAAASGAGPERPVAPAPRFGLLSPHIDYLRGGPVYAQVWEQAAEAAHEADLAVIFATDHSGSDPFTLTRQHYATPYGVLPTAVEIVDHLATAIGPDAAYAGELRHRGEHSIELVAVWLHHLRGGLPIEIVPILCGGLHPYILNGADPSTDALTNRVLEALSAATVGRKVLVVASGDLAHVGPAFSQPALTAATRATVPAADQELIRHMTAGDARGFFESIRRVRDRHNVCGVAPIYLTLRYLGQQGHVDGIPAGYASCPADEADTSAVTIGGMIFRGE